jgi:hypothetical protein
LVGKGEGCWHHKKAKKELVLPSGTAGGQLTFALTIILQDEGMSFSFLGSCYNGRFHRYNCGRCKISLNLQFLATISKLDSNSMSS